MDNDSLIVDCIRRIDDLGRVVMPKVVRKALHLKAGDDLEFAVAEDGTITLKRHEAPDPWRDNR